MTTVARGWPNNTYKASPADTDQASEGAEQIRNLKENIEQRLFRDHNQRTTTSAPEGHKQISFVTNYGATAKPTGEATDAATLFARQGILMFDRDPDGTGSEDEVSIGRDQHIPASGVGGSANAITLTPAPALRGYKNGQKFAFTIETSNTGAVTINVSGLGAKNFRKPDGNAFESGDLVAGVLVTALYDGSAFRQVGGGGAAAGDGATGPRGPTGPAGPTGPRGPQGQQGQQGARGPAGADGADGTNGQRGPQGIQGPRGLQGPTGATGPAGADGGGAGVASIQRGRKTGNTASSPTTSTSITITSVDLDKSLLVVNTTGSTTINSIITAELDSATRIRLRTATGAGNQPYAIAWQVIEFE